jgi:methyl-accepting chemotaxis protein
MFKPNNKKMLTVLITLAMVFSALAVISMAAQPAYAASGTFTVNPTTYTEVSDTANTPIMAYVSGGVFGSGSTVFFFLSKTTASTGIINGPGATVNSVTVSNAIGGVALSAGTTSLSNSVSFNFASMTIPAGNYYILAEDYISGAASGTYALGSEVTFVSVPANPSITVYNPATSESATVANALTVGSQGLIKGGDFDAGSSVTVYLNYPGSSTVLVTTTANAYGSIKAKFTVPALSGTVYSAPGFTSFSPAIPPYEVVAQETNALSTSFPLGGVTADAGMDIGPSISVSPMSTPGTIGSTFTITGSGFVAGQTIASSSSLASSIVIGVVQTSHSSVTVSTSGSFTVTVTLTGTITSSGPQQVSITVSGPSVVDVFTDAVYQSVPTLSNLGFSFEDLYTASSSSGYPDDPVAAAVWNFPASTTVTVTIGPYTIGTITTDSNGFGQLPSTAIIPEMPYGDYAVTASVASQGVYAVSSTFYINSEYYAMDPVGNIFGTGTTHYSDTEYIPYDANVTVFAYGLYPLTSYVFYDSGSGGNVQELGLVVSISVGTPNTAGTAIYPAANGTIIFTYQPFYAGSYSTSVTTGTPETVTISGNSYATGTVTTSNTLATYYEIGAPIISSPLQGSSLVPGTTASASVSNLIPYASTVTVYPTESELYSLYLGTSLLTVTLSGTTGTTFAVAPSSSTPFTVPATLTFTVPSGMNGLQSLSVVYGGSPVSSALNSEYVVVTTPGSTSAAIGALYNSETQTLYMWGYNFPSTVHSITVDYMTYPSGMETVSAAVTSGGFFQTESSLDEPAGTYSVFLPSQTGVPSVTPATYTVSPYFSSLFGGYEPVGSPFTPTAYGLQPHQQYLLYFGPVFLDEENTTSAGKFSYTEYVPTVAAGTYSLTLRSAASPSTVVLSQPFVVLQNSELSLSTMSQYAFPDQIVQFSVGGLSLPTLYGPNGPSGIMIPTGYEANVYLNGTLLATVPATFLPVSGSYYLNGSFKMPNNAAGSYYLLTISGIVEYQNTLGSSILSSSVLSTGSLPMIGRQSDFLGLAEGNGALITGISPSEIATIEFDINSTVSKSLSVPIAQLDAAITSINGAVANLKTTVGNITVALSTINATVLSVSKGVALLQTDLGQVQTSLASLNATLVSVRGNTAMIETTVGMVNTTVNSINMTVSSTATSVSGLVGSVATVQTSLGTLSGTVTSINGTVATIQTSIGTLQTSVNDISMNTSKISSLSSTLSTSEIFEIVILVLVLITLVLSFLAISSVNKVAKKVEEQKKQ